jgi:hypothetical protein
VTFRATGSVLEVPGFQTLYQEGQDEPDAEGGEDARRLPRIDPQAPLARGPV